MQEKEGVGWKESVRRYAYTYIRNTPQAFSDQNTVCLLIEQLSKTKVIIQNGKMTAKLLLIPMFVFVLAVSGRPRTTTGAGEEDLLALEADDSHEIRRVRAMRER